MVFTEFFTPVMQIGRELRIELALMLGTVRIGSLQRRPHAPIPPLPEQRVDDAQILQLRKAEAFLDTVRIGAVRR